jgi:hypothetical protein
MTSRSNYFNFYEFGSPHGSPHGSLHGSPHGSLTGFFGSDIALNHDCSSISALPARRVRVPGTEG